MGHAYGPPPSSASWLVRKPSLFNGLEISHVYCKALDCIDGVFLHPDFSLDDRGVWFTREVWVDGRMGGCRPLVKDGNIMGVLQVSVFYLEGSAVI